jgi:hypothetical protein
VGAGPEPARQPAVSFDGASRSEEVTPRRRRRHLAAKNVFVFPMF